ncbi:MAG: TIGR03089 family protein, partial [Actinomycetota bacterium]|nr:TIGR03089 family protein [Actinomycetota bacterium]
MSPPDPLSALAQLLRTSPSQPLVTFHDGSTGERVE